MTPPHECGILLMQTGQYHSDCSAAAAADIQISWERRRQPWETPGLPSAFFRVSGKGGGHTQWNQSVVVRRRGRFVRKDKGGKVMRMSRRIRQVLAVRSQTLVIVTLVVAVVAAVSFSAVSADAIVYTSPTEFEGATTSLGDPVVIDFEDIDASPLNNTILGRPTFDGSYYADQGITFYSPNAVENDLYIAPGGLFWNESNSLSVYRFPFDPYLGGQYHNEDDLVVELDPPCAAVGFTLIDLGGGEDEYVQFIDWNGDLVAQVGFPDNFAPFRAFVGIVSADRPIALINIVEQADDGDDVNYDDFVLFPATIEISIDIKPGSYPNSINLGSKGVVPVAVLTTAEFDASTVDPATVQFADAYPLRWAMEDVDYEGDLDLIFHFKTLELNLDMDSTEATLTGETLSALLIQGTDTVNIVP